MNVLHLILLFPFLGFLINGLVGSRLPKISQGLIAAGSVAISFFIAVGVFFDVKSTGAVVAESINWFSVGNLSVEFAYRVDALSSVMLLVVTGVGLLIHIYSIGYMAHDKSTSRYFSYLNLFMFMMLNLILGDNLIVLFLGWEGVGLCSYLLIGFWFTDYEKAIAGKKAFVVNRIGDFGLVLGVILLFSQFDTLSISGILTNHTAITLMGTGLATAIALLLFVGVTGKSAQIPLHVWLPDAMAGPTPVSALIHAATMVTAGVYLIARMNPIFLAAPFAMEVVAWVGIATILMAALIAMQQNDIKKVLAYSTVSQLGYMVLGVGVGAFSAGIMHLMTHAFFKALLFMGAGSVIHIVEHAVHHDRANQDPQDIRFMGGLRKKAPITTYTFLIAWLAIIGVPGLAGFFSKDWILEAAYGHSPILWFLGTVGAGITAFYMTRLILLTFFGTYRGKGENHLKDNTLWMTAPLMILAVLSVIGGWVGIQEPLAHHNHFAEYLSTSVEEHGHHLAHSTAWLLMGSSILAVVIGLAFAFRGYKSNSLMSDNPQGIAKWMLHKFYIDELYETLIIKPIHKGSVVLWKYFDVRGIDGIVNGSAKIAAWTGNQIRQIQTGKAPDYVLGMLVGLVVILILAIAG